MYSAAMNKMYMNLKFINFSHCFQEKTQEKSTTPTARDHATGNSHRIDHDHDRIGGRTFGGHFGVFQSVEIVHWIGRGPNQTRLRGVRDSHGTGIGTGVKFYTQTSHVVWNKSLGRGSRWWCGFHCSNFILLLLHLQIIGTVDHWWVAIFDDHLFLVVRSNSKRHQ